MEEDNDAIRDVVEIADGEDYAERGYNTLARLAQAAKDHGTVQAYWRRLQIERLYQSLRVNDELPVRAGPGAAEARHRLLTTACGDITNFCERYLARWDRVPLNQRRDFVAGMRLAAQHEAQVGADDSDPANE